MNMREYATYEEQATSLGFSEYTLRMFQTLKKEWDRVAEQPLDEFVMLSIQSDLISAMFNDLVNIFEQLNQKDPT